ncbi:MAG: hypothetical protein HN350_18290 [Phycisphaerales bacterium]|nr:hypothetical protein [Phycisphaerales bacterium]
MVLGSVYAMYLLGFLTLAYIAIHRFLVDRKAAPGSADRAKSATVRPFGLALTIRGAGAILPLALLPLPIYQCSTSTEKLDLLSSYYCSRSEWGRVIELNCRGGQAEHEQYSVNLNHDLNRALYHTGQLGETMFEYRQTLPALLLMKTADVMHPPATAIRRIEVMMELGHLGSAEQMALELLETSDGWPLVVEKLAHLQLVKRQNETARIFLNNLAKDLVHAPGAKRLLRCLDKDPELTAYTPVQHLRSIANETDQPLAVVSTEMFFGDLLRKNPRNKMAFEYMMTQYLLTARLDKFLDNIHRLKDLGYDKSPRHYEEALAVMTVNGASPQAMHGYRPSPEAIGKAARFEKICNSFSYRENDEASRKAAISAARKKLQGLFWANIYIL